MNKAAIIVLGQLGDMVLDSIAKASGVGTATIMRVLEAGIPSHVKLIVENPALARKLYLAALQMLPGEVEVYYRLLPDDTTLVEVSLAEYQQMFGPGTTDVNDLIASESEVSVDHVNAIMSAVMPAFKMTLKTGIERDDVKGAGFSMWLMRPAQAAE